MSQYMPLNDETASAPRFDPVSGFDAVCESFMRLTKLRASDAAPLLGGPLRTNLFLILHPIHAARVLARAHTSLNDIAIHFPVSRMLSELRQYTTGQLTAIKDVSEVNVQAVERMVRDNPVFKLAAGLGVFYALIKGTLELSRSDRSVSFVHPLLDGTLQPLLDGTLLMLFVGAITLAIQYPLFLWPRMGRARVLDDVLKIALIERRAAETQTDDAA